MNLADVYDRVAQTVKDDAPAIICNGERTSWREFDARVRHLASAFVRRGLKPNAKVALYMRNGADYLIAFTACFRARLVPVNINYRYGPSEIDYLLDNSDAEAIIFDAEFTETLENTNRASALRLRATSRGSATSAIRLSDLYSEALTGMPAGRSGDDIMLLYTGGTTGMPKGVMWPGSTIWEALASARVATPGAAPANSLTELENLIRTQPSAPRYYIAPPLMHGTGLFSAISVLSRGGCVVCSAEKSFDPCKALHDIDRHRCDGIVIVGDAFARPLLKALDADKAAFDVGHVTAVVSSGMMWSPEVKRQLLHYMPNAAMSDGLGASEASSIAFSVTTKDSATKAASFVPVDALVVDPETLVPLAPGTGKVGVIAKAGPLPSGYYKDPDRTARTYVEIGGRQHMISGDHATLEADGTITLLGRGSHCINTAGEKVYPEEVEEILKSHPSVSDALVFGLEDERFGQAVNAVVSINVPTDERALKDHVKANLADYKAPKSITIVATVPRAPNGKADYAAAKLLHRHDG